MNRYMIQIEDDELDRMVVDALLNHKEYCDDESVTLACQILLDFYGVCRECQSIAPSHKMDCGRKR